MTDHPPEDAPDGFDEIPPDDEPVESPLVMPIERVNALLGRWYRLQADVDDYDRLHNAEIERLSLRREAAVGPIERRIRRIQTAVEEFAVRSFLDFGKTSHRVPNGDIKSRPVVPGIEYDGKELFDWTVGMSAFDDICELRPWFDKKKLRAWLDRQVELGHIERLVIHDQSYDHFQVVDETVGWHSEFPPGYIGVWFWTETGAEEFGMTEGEILRGVTWSPNGTFGSGRNFKVTL